MARPFASGGDGKVQLRRYVAESLSGDKACSSPSGGETAVALRDNRGRRARRDVRNWRARVDAAEVEALELDSASSISCEVLTGGGDPSGALDGADMLKKDAAPRRRVVGEVGDAGAGSGAAAALAGLVSDDQP